MTLNLKLLTFFMLTFSGVLSDVVNVITTETRLKNDQKNRKYIAVTISHGENAKKINKAEDDDFNIQAPNFICLKKGESLELKLLLLVNPDFKMIVNVSYDFGEYKSPNSLSDHISFKKKSKVCFFHGYFTRIIFDNQDKAELFLNFITDEKLINPNHLLSFEVLLNEEGISTHLRIFDGQDRNFIEIEGTQYDMNRLAIYELDRDFANNFTKVSLNKQVITLDGNGQFKTIFYDPRYAPKTDEPRKFYGKNSLMKGLLEIKCVNNEIEILFPGLVNPGANLNQII